MTGISCPHCAASVMPAAFCSACGMALPSLTPSSPRVVSRKSVAQTAAGQKLQSVQLLLTAKQAARSLLSIGIINLAFGGLNVYIIMTLYSGRMGRIPIYLEALTASMLIAGAVYVGMFYWAKFSPLAATVVGLGVYLAKWGIDLAIQENLGVRSKASTPNYTTYGLFRILMVVYLVRGIGAALKHRKLEQQQMESAQPMPVLPVE